MAILQTVHQEQRSYSMTFAFLLGRVRFNLLYFLSLHPVLISYQGWAEISVSDVIFRRFLWDFSKQFQRHGMSNNTADWISFTGVFRYGYGVYRDQGENMRIEEL